MRRAYLTLIILLAVFSIAVYFFTKPLLLSIAEKELRKTFKESSISGLKITTSYIEFHGIGIREDGSYDLRIKRLKIYYNLSSILKKRINKIEVSDADLDLNKGGIKIKLNSYLRLDMATQYIDYIKLNISSCKTGVFDIEGLTLNASQGNAKGEFYIKSINHDKLKLADIIGKSELKGKLLYINPLEVSFLGGNVKGAFSITLDGDMDYNLSLNTQGMDIKRFVDDMKFNEKFDMTGRLGGAFYLSGKGEDIKDMKGDFTTDFPGGVLIIKDKTFLENISSESNQPFDKLVESFSNYNYNNGVVKLFIENGNIVLDLRLDGSAGKRGFMIVLHDFKKGKGAP